MKKIKYFLLLILIMLVCVVGIIFIIKNSDTEYLVDESKKEYYIGKGWHELILEVAKKNNDWTGLPLSKKFRKKYNSKDGILGKIEFDTIELNPFSAEDNYIGTMTHLLVKNGKKRSVYIYWQKYENKTNLLDDVSIVGPIDISDEKGEEIDYRLPFIGDAKLHNIFQLVRGNIYETGVAITEKFHKKYPFFLDLFIHYSPLSYNDIAFLREESDIDNNIAIFEVNSILECKRRKYEVKLIFDDKMYLDDAEVKLVKEEEYRGDNSERINKITYQNSNWDNLKLTDNFRKKYNSENGIIDDINNINIDIDVDEVTLEMNRKYVTCFTYKNGDKISYLFEYLEDQDGKLDKVLCEKLPYINKTAAEVKELYLKEHNIE